MASDKKQLSAAKCTALNRRGERCGAIAGPDGLCSIHSGRTDPAHLGRLGGTASVRSRFGLDGIADDDLREKARQRLNAMLDSDSEQVRLAASKALFSYSTTPAPGGAGSGIPYVARSIEYDYTKILDVLEEAGVLHRGQRPADVDVPEITRLRQRVAELEAELGKRSADE
jgi:hypothetical protein